MNIKKHIFFILFLLVSTTGLQAQKAKQSKESIPGKVWSVEKANAWYNEHKWISGANFIPSTAINQLEMWQAETFDPQTIDRELGWAEKIGFNTMRVYLHSLAYMEDPYGFM